MFATDPLALLIGGLLAGFVFGVLLQKGGVATYQVIVGQFLLTDHTVLKVMFTAIVVGGFGIYGLQAVGLVAALAIKPAYLLGVGMGGVIFGVGMALMGYCPGTLIAAIGQGSRHALFGLFGGIVGAALYTEVYPFIEPNILRVWDLGKVTFADLLGVSPFLLLTVLAVIALGTFAAVTRWERQQTPVENA